MIHPLARIEFFAIHGASKKSVCFKNVVQAGKFVKGLHKKNIKWARMREVMYGNDSRDKRYIVIY